MTLVAPNTMKVFSKLVILLPLQNGENQHYLLCKLSKLENQYVYVMKIALHLTAQSSCG